MFLCPKCGEDLARYRSPHGQFWGCTHCRGRAVNLLVLRKSVLASAVNAIWRTVWDEPHRRVRPCPACRQPMCEVRLEAGANPFPIDVCKNCQFFWFDTDEFESLPPPEPLKPAEVDAELRAESGANSGRPGIIPEDLGRQLTTGTGIGFAELCIALSDCFSLNPD